MGCISSRSEYEDISPTIFEVINVDEHGNQISSGKIEVTEFDLVLYQENNFALRWPLNSLKKYGFDAEYFSFECGRRSLTGPAIYGFQCERAEQLFKVLQNRILSLNNLDNDITDSSSNSNDSSYLEPIHLPRRQLRRGFSGYQGSRRIRLCSIGSPTGSPESLSPKSITSFNIPLDIVPLISPQSRSPLRQVDPLGPLGALNPLSPKNSHIYVNEEIIFTVAQSLKESNNNKIYKTSEEPISSPTDHSYLNSDILELLLRHHLRRPAVEYQNVLFKKASIPIFDNNHLYMNVSPKIFNVARSAATVETQTEFPPILVNAIWDSSEGSIKSYANVEIDGSLPQLSKMDLSILSGEVKNLNYIVLDLKPGGDTPKSPTSPTSPTSPISPTSPTSPASPDLPDTPTKISEGYAAIDFKKTVALSNSVNPSYDTDSESSRKTRHSSNISKTFSNERRNSSVSE